MCVCVCVCKCLSVCEAVQQPVGDKQYSENEKKGNNKTRPERRRRRSTKTDRRTISWCDKATNDNDERYISVWLKWRHQVTVVWLREYWIKGPTMTEIKYGWVWAAEQVSERATERPSDRASEQWIKKMQTHKQIKSDFCFSAVQRMWNVCLVSHYYLAFSPSVGMGCRHVSEFSYYFGGSLVTAIEHIHTTRRDLVLYIVDVRANCTLHATCNWCRSELYI